MRKRTKRFSLGLMAAAVLVFAGAGSAGFAATPDSENLGGQVVVEGTATVYGEWSCKGDAVVETTPGDALVPVPGFPGGVQSTLVTVTIKDIDCGDGTMNKHMRKALKEDKNPTIQFKTDKYSLNENGDVVKAVGELTIAGVTNPVELDASLVRNPDGSGFHVEGKVGIQMKDYKVKPPSLFFGTLKVANDVSISYTADIAPSGEMENASASLATN